MKYIYHYITLFFMLPFVVACQDDFPADYYVVGDGEGVVTASVAFESFGETNLSSRAGGEALKSINTLYVLRYNADEELLEKTRINDFKVFDTNNDRPVENDGTPAYNTSAETNTPIATFSMKIPFGRYHIYVVANIDIDSEWGDKSGYDTVEKLLAQKVTWDSSNISNNAQMFGYFSNNNRAVGLRSTELVTVNGNHLQLRAWIKRIASKVTIAFDTHELYDNVYIYLKSASIKHIPREAFVGLGNTPTSISDLITSGETLYFAGADASQTDARANYLNWRQLVKGDSIWGFNSERNSVAGLPPLTGFEQRIAREHLENIDAFYFYENMQGQGKSKLQDADGDSQIDFPYPDESKPGTGWKDEKLFGTYMEVEGYYINRDSVCPGRGPITYRFMMGKDVETDYNAERNRHYKLTLRFKGYANDYDWHIDYLEEAKPGSVAPDTAYVSYMYNQRHTMAVRSTPREGYKLTKVAATILKNEWRPDCEVKPGVFQNIDATGFNFYNIKAWNMQINNEGSYTAPRYDTDANDPDRKRAAGDKRKNDPNCEFGWLSLREVSNVMVDLHEDANHLDDLVKNARFNYFDKVPGDTNGSKGYREYKDIPDEPTPPEGHISRVGVDGDDGNDVMLDGYYTVHLEHKPLGGGRYEKNYVVNVPLFTRAKSIGYNWAVYSGANPYYEHERHAYVRTVMYFENDEGDKYQDTCYTNVQQTQRIDNPRGIYRSHNRIESFRVQLMNTMLNPAGSKEFAVLKSRGAWSVEIERDPYGLVRLSKGGKIVTGEGGKIEGLTGTEIDFTYTPNRIVGADDAIGAILTVRYHNNCCVHKIIVRQGYGPVQLHLGSLKWSSLNAYDGGHLVQSPLSPGSFFKYQENLNEAIAESNTYRTDYNFNLHEDPGSNAPYTVINQNGTKTSKKWTDINFKSSTYNAFGEFTMSNSRTYRVPTPTEVYNELLRDGSDIQFAFGMVYGDGAVRPSDTSDAYSYSDTDNLGGLSSKGARGALAYCLSHGDNIFFPFGSTGHGRRSSFQWRAKLGALSGSDFTENGITYNVNAHGVLRYGDVGARLGGDNKKEDKGPLGMNTYNKDSDNYRPMAYRLPEQYGAIYWCVYDGTTNLAIDFNSNNFQVNLYPTGNLNFGRTNGCDALLLRPVWISSN